MATKIKRKMLAKRLTMNDIGSSFRCRDGTTVVLKGRSGGVVYPWRVDAVSSRYNVDGHGRSCVSYEDDYDLIRRLPSAAKKATKQ